MQVSSNNLKIFFGDTQPYLADMAKKHDSSAWIVDSTNFEKITNNDPSIAGNTVYTALGDLPKDLSIAYRVLSMAKEIFYCPPHIWSDNKKFDISYPGDSIQGLSEIMLNLLPNDIVVHNFDRHLPDPVPLVDSRKVQTEQLWVAGCSVSHGVGVSNDERYGQLLAEALSMECSFLTRQGSAIDWAADQICRSDIRENDIVVFGVTGPERLTHVHDNQLLNGVGIRTYEFYPEYRHIVEEKNLFSHQTLYSHMYAIQRVVNFCKKIKAKLILLGVILGEHNLLNFLKTQVNYIQVPYKIKFSESNIQPIFLDVGSDLIHPGPKQHEQYKDLILQKLNH